MSDTIKQLEQRLAEAHLRAEQVTLLNELAYAHRYLDIQKTRTLAMDALQLAVQDTALLDSIYYSRVMLAMADVYTGNYEAALVALADIETQLGSEWITPRTCIAALLQLGQCHIGLSNYPPALAYLLQALRLCQNHQVRDYEYSTYLGLGSVYAQLNQLDAALEAEQRALQLAHELDDPSKVFMATSNLAITYLERGDAQKALELQEAAMPFFTQDETASNFASVDLTRARAYAALHQLDLAEPLIEGVLRILADGHSKDDLAEALQLRAELYEQAGQWPAALDYFEQALRLAEKVGNKDRQANIHRQLAVVYRQLGHTSHALDHHEAFHRLHTEIFNHQADLRLKSLEIVHRTAAARQEANLLQLQNAELEQRVAKRTAELEATLVREQAIAHELSRALTAEAELSQLKSQIITTVSHEFRTPLAIISTSVELLTRHGDRFTADRKLHIEQRINHALFALRDLVQDIVMVDATHNRAITPQLTALPFAELCHDLENRVRDDLSYPPNLTLRYADQSTIVWMDESLLRQIVFDLLSNAVKYSEATDPIDASIELDGQSLSIVVHDQGIGILAHDIERIFQLFYRGSNVSTRSGLGLGLYIVDKLVHAMDGTVTAESDGAGQGSTFRVLLPLKSGPVS